MCVVPRVCQEMLFPSFRVCTTGSFSMSTRMLPLLLLLSALSACHLQQLTCVCMLCVCMLCHRTSQLLADCVVRRWMLGSGLQGLSGALHVLFPAPHSRPSCSRGPLLLTTGLPATSGVVRQGGQLGWCAGKLRHCDGKPASSPPRAGVVLSPCVPAAPTERVSGVAATCLPGCAHCFLASGPSGCDRKWCRCRAHGVEQSPCGHTRRRAPSICLPDVAWCLALLRLCWYVFCLYAVAVGVLVAWESEARRLTQTRAAGFAGREGGSGWEWTVSIGLGGGELGLCCGVDAARYELWSSLYL